MDHAWFRLPSATAEEATSPNFVAQDQSGLNSTWPALAAQGSTVCANAASTRSTREPCLAGIEVEIRESGVPRKMEAAGDKWDRPQRVWLLPLSKALELGLEPRIVVRPCEKKPILMETSF